MNENDLIKDEVKEEKVKKTAAAKTKAKVETKTVEVKAEKKTVQKAVTAKTETAPKAKPAKANPEEVVEAVAEPKARKTKAAVKAEAVAEGKPKVTKAKAEKVKAQPKVKKTEAEKIVAEVSDDEARPAALPLEAKIQTQENFDLTESETEEAELSPVFKKLAEPKLPTLREENRAFLQIQSPTRVFFYWSLKQDSYNTLRRALGNRADDYSLAIRLTNLSTNREEVHRVEARGSWWFNQIEADSKYRAEVGFYAPHRPFVRIVFSNTLETPRQKPSLNTAYQPYFAVNAEQFAEVLDLAGFSQDAFEVYVEGDEPEFADHATQKAFAQLAGKGQIDFSSISLNELRYVLFALASGLSLFALRDQVSGDLFEFLAALVNENPEALTEEKVILALEEFFGFSPFEEELEEEYGAPTVFGASLINFPSQLRRKKTRFSPGKLKEEKISPLSSFSLK